MSKVHFMAAMVLAACGTFATNAFAAHKVTHHTPKAAEPKVLPAASPEQLQAAERILVGKYACEFNQTVDVAAHPVTPGYMDVHFKGKVMTMKPVLSSTGALRLEDVTGKTLMVQIANKSMLMDTKLGQRMVDECMHPQQVQAAAALKQPS